MLALAFVSFAHAPAEELFEKPFRWHDAHGIVDLERGEAAPSLVDLDADGLADLVAGTASDRRMLWYRNTGTAQAPRFIDPAWLELPRFEGASAFADLDGDGILDLVTGDGATVRIARGLGQRSFAPLVELRDRRGGEIHVATGRTLAIADWDGDGVPDLIGGGSGAALRLLSHIGLGTAAPKFGSTSPLETVDVEPVPTQAPAPVVVDWDGDGVLDLLVGSSEGSVVLYPGFDEEGAHRLRTGEVLLQPCYVDQPATLAKNERSGALEPQLTRSHRMAIPAACDWNGDGRMDLLVGDMFWGAEPEPQLSTEQQARRKELYTQQRELAIRLAACRKAVEERVDLDLIKLELDPAAPKVRETREALIRLRKSEDLESPGIARRLDAIAQELEPLSAKQQRHAYIWVYLRKGAELARAK